MGAAIKDERGGNRLQDSGGSHAPFGISQIGPNEATGINYGAVGNWLKDNSAKVRTEGKRKGKRFL